KVLVWILGKGMAQERLCKRKQSRACVLICVKLAEYHFLHNIMFPKMPRGKLSYGDSRLKNFDPKVVRRLPCFLPAKPLCAFVNALIDGNDEFDQLVIEMTKTKLKIEAKNRPLAKGMKPDEILLGVEDAINLMGSGMHRVQESDVFENFYTDLKNVLSHAFRQM
uniref:Uncharacterized protein n=1 Tax=Acrobeloides nanus TaxID=290746 RepID=A0A914DBQ0_9BILA